MAWRPDGPEGPSSARTRVLVVGRPSERTEPRGPTWDPLPDWRTTTVIALGGAGGAGVRWGIGELEPGTSAWPWAAFVVNLAGCAALGWLVDRRAHLSDRFFAGAALGFCGALTTFSAFAVDLAAMLRDEQLRLAVAYLVASFVGGLLAFVGGSGLGHRRDPVPSSS